MPWNHPVLAWFVTQSVHFHLNPERLHCIAVLSCPFNCLHVTIFIQRSHIPVDFRTVLLYHSQHNSLQHQSFSVVSVRWDRVSIRLNSLHYQSFNVFLWDEIVAVSDAVLTHHKWSDAFCSHGASKKRWCIIDYITRADQPVASFQPAMR